MNGIIVYKRLLQYAKRYWSALLLGLLGTLLASLTDAGFAWLLKPLLDKGFIAKDQHFIRWIPLLIILAFIMRGITGFLSNYYMVSAGRQVVMQFRQAIFKHLLHLPAQFYDKHSVGQLLSILIYNVDQVAKASTDSLVTLVQESFFIVGLLLVMLATSWQLTLLFLITMPLIALVAKASSLRMRGLNSRVQQSMSSISQTAQEVIEGYKVIRIFAGSDYEIDKFNRLTQKNCQQELKVTATNATATAAVQLLAAMMIALTVYLATSQMTEITAGGFTSMIAAMLALLKPMRNLTTVNNTIQKGIAGAASIFALLDLPVEKDQGQKPMLKAKGDIAYAGVNFAYQVSSPAVLHDIHFTVRFGQTVALVGRSGSGKSTLVHLLPRFYSGYSGSITIDGQDIQTIQLADLRDQFAFVSQQVTLFDDTLANNIGYGKLNRVTEAQIWQACDAAHATEFIQKLPQRLQTRVGPNGVLLSGGQRQRIAIARALLKDAPILILDEATSALDTEAEQQIQAALNMLMRKRTTLVIAHRLSTIEHADLILVLNEGRIIERGTHNELLALKGYYAKLYRMQFRDD